MTATPDKAPAQAPKVSRFQQDAPEMSDEDSDGDDDGNQRTALPALTDHGHRVRIETRMDPKVIVVPSARPPTQTCKVDEDMDDGIYRARTMDTHLPPHVLARAVERVEREGDTWSSMADPFAASAVRPSLTYAPPTPLRTHWSDPAKVLPVYSELLVRIPKLHLSDHRLMTLEDSVSLQMRFLFHDYTAKYAAMTSLEHRLARLLSLAPTASIHDVHAEADAFMAILTSVRDAFQEVYAKWSELKELRQKQQATLTPVLLLLRPVDSSATQTMIQDFATRLECHEHMREDPQLATAVCALQGILDAPMCLNYVVRLSSDLSILGQPSEAEALRRQHIRRVRVHCELLVNGNTVMETKAHSLSWPSLSVDLNEYVALRVTAKPNSMSLKVYERVPATGGIFYTTTCWTSRPIPLVMPGHAFATEICAAGAAPTDEWYQFCHDAVIPREAWSHSFLSSAYYANAQRHTKGAVHVHLSWKTTSDVHKIPVKHARSIRLASDAGRWIGHRPEPVDDATHFSHEAAFQHALGTLPTLDPNAPSDQAAVQLMAYHTGRSTTQTLDLFRTELPSSFVLSSYTGKSQLKRHTLLTLRDDDPHRHAIFATPIPLSEHTIAQQPAYLDLVRPEVVAFERSLANEAMLAETRDGLEYTKRRLELRRHDFMERVRSNHATRARDDKVSAYGHLSTIVQEYPQPLLFKGWTPDFSGWSTLFARKRRLRPTRKVEGPRSDLAVDRPDECQVYIQVQRLTNAFARRGQRVEAPPKPARRRPDHRSDDDNSAEDDDDDDHPVDGGANQVLVEVSFQGHTRATSPSSGLHPMWMETVVVPFSPPLHDWSPPALTRIRDTITLTIFDQVLLEDPVTQRKDPQRRFLGSVRVPFSTLYHNAGEIVAPLRCVVPYAHLGYMRRVGKASRFRGAHDESNGTSSSDAATFLSVMIKTDPILAAPTPASTPITVHSEPPAFIRYAEKYVASVPGLTLQHLFVPAVSGEPTFITRYLRAQAPPADLQGQPLRALARFVSLVPFLEDWHTYSGAIDVWAATQDFLDTQVGDWEEHAVLLANYFNWADDGQRRGHVKSYLVVGTALPEGSGVYVVRCTPQHCTFWNACSGVAYDVRDPKCPLRSVLLVASSDNVWANLRPTMAPCQLAWDTIESDMRAWKPFFTAQTSKEALEAILPSVQAANPQYLATPPSFVHDVQVELLESIKVAIRKLRSSHSTTVFNSDVSFHLQEVLRTLEAKYIASDVGDDDHVPALLAKYPRYDFHGGPFSFPFTDVQAIVDEITQTHIHATTMSGVEFGLAVHVHVYPNFVLAVWVYLAAITPTYR
ncbi:hypothetical protein SPRG_10351 [Saprolegnia parasitica CBS 223.65]|uniref:Uncharacterized protein n=1 Tax=Saprolegnia parasitica (strain CBS 223.65) TaxID=695850 RepID=A0A067C5V3_SAPPC|nr:hypothetical protein SPRG_10351 [Saprolegnia parasitica CBS 223.65]KDO24535.1 hypothetical protein SPRG_10351 [Saprolegnia parasitica CBS 223.65]|eukprot:XP_012204797.1 hypothetical protein SPRG_10351 [Saprolegnia parasitica CBS 223.65]